jgi:hypothetical protein
MANDDRRRAQELAVEYAQRVFFTVDLHVGEMKLTDEQNDKIFTAVHQALVDAFVAGYRACEKDQKESGDGEASVR